MPTAAYSYRKKTDENKQENAFFTSSLYTYFAEDSRTFEITKQKTASLLEALTLTSQR